MQLDCLHMVYPSVAILEVGTYFQSFQDRPVNNGHAASGYVVISGVPERSGFAAKEPVQAPKIQLNRLRIQRNLLLKPR